MTRRELSTSRLWYIGALLFFASAIIQMLAGNGWIGLLHIGVAVIYVHAGSMS